MSKANVRVPGVKVYTSGMIIWLEGMTLENISTAIRLQYPHIEGKTYDGDTIIIAIAKVAAVMMFDGDFTRDHDWDGVSISPI